MSRRASLVAGRSDTELVNEWAAPLSLAELRDALADAGFSADVYRSCFADLHAQLDDEAAGLLHFLRHGFAEERVFPVELDLAGLDRLRRLPVANRFYLRHLCTALTGAWLGHSLRSAADLSRHAATLGRFRQSGGMPFLLIGDRGGVLYRRSDWSGSRWLCPLAIGVLEEGSLSGGIDALAVHDGDRLLPPPGLLSEPEPTLWAFGHADLGWGWLAHRLHEGIEADDTGAATAWVRGRVERYLSTLCRAVGAADRPMHWLACALPPVPIVCDPRSAAAAVPAVLPEQVAARGITAEQLTRLRPDSLLHRTLLADGFNAALRDAAREAGFNLLDSFDRLLSAHGLIDGQFLPPQREADLPDQQATRGIFSSALWAMVAAPPRATEAPSMREQFDHLLRDIRAAQLG